MLDGDDWRRIATALGEAFDVDDLKDLFRVTFNKELSQVARTDKGEHAISDLMTFAENKGLWQRLLEAAREARKTNVQFTAVCDPILGSIRVKEKALMTPASGTDGQARRILLLRRIPFVDRDPIREAMKEMDRPDGWCGLVINGPTKVGKTYCEQYLAHERLKRWPNDRLAAVNLDREPSRTIELLQLASRLCLAIRQQETRLSDPQPGQKPEVWAVELAVAVANHADQCGQRVWILLDGFDHPSVRPEIHNFIAKLAEEALHRDRFRLILMGYTKLWDDQIELTIRRESLTYLTADDLKNFFEELNAQRQFRGVPACKMLEDAADSLVKNYGTLKAGDPAQVQALRIAFLGIVRNLMKQLFDAG